MLHKGEVIHGINSTYELKFYQSAPTQKIYCMQYNTLSHSKQVVQTEVVELNA